MRQWLLLGQNSFLCSFGFVFVYEIVITLFIKLFSVWFRKHLKENKQVVYHM